jgi:hypothetical protein
MLFHSHVLRVTLLSLYRRLPAATRGGKEYSMDLHRIPEQEIPNIVAQWEAQHFVLSMPDTRLRRTPHFYKTPHEIDAPLEALP